MKKVLTLLVLMLPMALWFILTIINIVIELLCEYTIQLADRIENKINKK